jgi:3-hydroxyisobutyrate dehydrogenase-like beta-hydroxyacid dehydrogenase
MKTTISESRSTPSDTVVGVLYAGELGAAFGEILTKQGFTVVSTVAGRSARTAERCHAAGMAVLPSLADVVSQSDVILATVVPEAAIGVARAVRQELTAGHRPLIYVDTNSVSRQTIQDIAEQLQGQDTQVIDVAVHGPASRLTSQATLFASGADTEVISALFEPEVRVRLLGNTAGMASTMKMALGGMSKGMIGLFLQSSLAAREAGITTAFCDELRRFYPDVLQFVERSLPTYLKHADRRSQEMRALAKTLRAADLPTEIASGLSGLFSTIAASDLATVCSHERHPISTTRFIELIAATHATGCRERVDGSLVEYVA